MQEQQYLLPVIYKNSNLVKRTANEQYIDKRNDQRSITVSKKRKSPAPYFVISIFLCFLSIISVIFYLGANFESIFSTENIINYISKDFLGIDGSDSGKNIFELMLSGRFSDSSKPPQTLPPIIDTEHVTDDSKEESDTAKDEDIAIPPENKPIIPEGEFAIIPIDLSSKQTAVSNKTGYDIDISEYLSKGNENDGYSLNINDDMTISPIVLIVHTHGTEAYSEEGSISYSDTYNIPRTEDTTQNVVSIGAHMADIFNSNGIPTVHCDIMHDKDSYKNSYDRAAKTIEWYLKKYPTIEYVFDVHRDSVINESKVKYKPITNIDGKSVAQIMAVMGSNYSYKEHVNWQSNLTLAIKLTERLNQKYDSFTRPISLRQTSYNQEYTKGSMLLEIGSCGNTLSEAKEAATILTKELCEIIKSGW